VPPRIGKGLGDLSDSTLRFYAQVGVEEVALPDAFTTEPRASRPHVPPAQMRPPAPTVRRWDGRELERMRRRTEEFGLRATAKAFGLSKAILLGGDEAERDLEAVAANVRTAGEAGLTVLTYSFTGLRASEGYFALNGAGRGGTHLRGFDFARVRDLPPLEAVGQHSRAAMWERLESFLRAILPVAESAGVKIAMHPNDPPVETFRGVAQPVRSLDDLRRVVQTVDSPANTLYLDTGVLTEMGEDAPAAIREFGARGKIGIVHFRNVVVEQRYERYVETLLDAGDCDMAACMGAFVDAGYDGAIDPDHTPGFDGDTLDTHVGWAYAIGQIIGLRAACS
jgi:mannonate dehydratase